MSNKLLVDVPTGRRALLIIQNNGANALGISFDGPKDFPEQCAIILQAGGAVLFDAVVPQNRVYGVHNSLTDIPVGVTVANVE